ncbi:hypothetical protein F5884DRAFT_657614, partial [Xylogone sp. PMI_703]
DPESNEKCSIHHLAQYGIVGRGILLDFRQYAQKINLEHAPLKDTCTTYHYLHECGRDQGIDVGPASRGGDILFVQTGWMEAYSVEERKKPKLRDFHKTEGNGIWRFSGFG